MSLVAGATYLAVFAYSYVIFVAPSYYYFGFHVNNLGAGELLSLVIFALLPTLLFPDYCLRISDYVVRLMYFMIYVPAVFVTMHASEDYIDRSTALLLNSVLFVCFSALVLVPRLPKIPMPRVRLPRFFSLRAVLFITTFLFLYVVFRLRSNLSLNGFFDFVAMYDRRDAIIATGGAILLYIIPWLANVLLPVSYAHFSSRSPWRSGFLLVIAYLALFVAAGAKMYLFAPAFFVLGALFVAAKRSGALFLGAAFSIVLMVGPLARAFSDPLGRALTGVLNLRTFSVQGLAPAIYHNHVESSGFTEFMHIRPLAALFGEPASTPVSVRLNEIYGLGNFNSNFLYGDGYVGAGYLGMLIATCFVILFLYALDCATHGISRKKVILSMSVFIPSFFNVPLMTSLLTGGGILLLLYFLAFGKELRS